MTNYHHCKPGHEHERHEHEWHGHKKHKHEKDFLMMFLLITLLFPGMCCMGQGENPMILLLLMMTMFK